MVYPLQGMDKAGEAGLGLVLGIVQQARGYTGCPELSGSWAWGD